MCTRKKEEQIFHRSTPTTRKTLNSPTHSSIHIKQPSLGGFFLPSPRLAQHYPPHSAEEIKAERGPAKKKERKKEKKNPSQITFLPFPLPFLYSQRSPPPLHFSALLLTEGKTTKGGIELEEHVEIDVVAVSGSGLAEMAVVTAY